MKQRIQQIVIAAKATTPVAVALAVLLWLFGVNTSWSMEGVCLLLGIASVYMLVELNNAFSLLGRRTTFHAVLFPVVWMSVPQGAHLPESALLTFALLLAVYFLFGCYQATAPVERVFCLFLIVSAVSLLIPQILWLTPLFYLSLLVFKALSSRSFFAGVAGILFPYWLLFVYAFYEEDLELFYTPLRALFHYDVMVDVTLSVGSWVSLGFIALLSVVGSVYAVVNGYHDKIRTRVFLRFFLWLQGLCLLFVLFCPLAFQLVSGVMSSVCCILLVHMFTLAGGRLCNIFFMFSVVTLLFLIVCNLWMPSYSFF